jgi:hypothetical protein
MTRGAARAVAAAVLALAATADGASIGPEPGVAGVPAGKGLPAERTCIACHASSPLNPDTAGRIVLTGLPERYEPGARYTLTVAVSHSDPTMKRWGFELTAVALPTLHGAGELVVTDPKSTQLVFGDVGDRQYIGHSLNGTAPGKAGGASWSFEWVAPKPAVGPVAFFGAGNAANLDGSKEGDRVYSPSPAPLATVQPRG